MPLEPEDLRSLVAVQGYLELELFLEANAELDEIDPARRHRPKTIRVTGLESAFSSRLSHLWYNQTILPANTLDLSARKNKSPNQP